MLFLSCFFGPAFSMMLFLSCFFFCAFSVILFLSWFSIMLFLSCVLWNDFCLTWTSFVSISWQVTGHDGWQVSFTPLLSLESFLPCLLPFLSFLTNITLGYWLHLKFKYHRVWSEILDFFSLFRFSLGAEWDINW